MPVLKPLGRGSQMQAMAEPAAHSVSQSRQQATRPCFQEVVANKFPDSRAVVGDVHDSGALGKSGAGLAPSVKDPSSKIDRGTYRDDVSDSDSSYAEGHKVEDESHIEMDNNNCEGAVALSSKKQSKAKYFKWKDPKVFNAMITGMMKMEQDVMLLNTAACKKAFEMEMLPHGGAPAKASLDTFRRALVAVQSTARQIFEMRLGMSAMLDKFKAKSERQALMNSNAWIVLHDSIRDLMVNEVYYKTNMHDPQLEERILKYAEKLQHAKEVKLGYSAPKKISLQQGEIKGGNPFDSETMGGSVATGALKATASRVDSVSDESEAEGQLDEEDDDEPPREPTGKDQKKRKARGWTSESEAERQLNDEDGDEQEDQPKKKRTKVTARGQPSDRPMDRAKRLSLLDNGSKLGIDLGSVQETIDEAVLQPFMPIAQLTHQMVDLSKTLVTFEGKFERIHQRFDALDCIITNMGSAILRKIEMLASKIDLVTGKGI